MRHQDFDGSFRSFFNYVSLGGYNMVMGFGETGILTTVQYIIEMNYLDAPSCISSVKW